MSTTTTRLALQRPQRGDLDWDDEIQAWLDRLDTYGGFGDKTLTWTAAQQFALVGIGAAPDPSLAYVLNVDGVAPASVAGNGTSGGGIQLLAADGGATSGTTGQAAADGGGVTINAGAGGTAPSGSTNGNGGAIFLTAGTPGAGAGTAGVRGVISLEAIQIQLAGSLQLIGTTQSLTADNTTLNFTAGTLGLLVLSSNDAVAANRTMVMPGVTDAGIIRVLAWMSTNAGELVDNGAVSTATGNVRLSATWTPTQYDTLVLMSVDNGGGGFDWLEITRSTN